MLPDSRRSAQLRRPFIELHRRPHDLDGLGTGVGDVGDVPVGDGLGILCHLERVLDDLPRNPEGGQAPAPLGKWRAREGSLELAYARVGMLAPRLRGGEPRIVDEVLATDVPAQVGPNAAGVRDVEQDEATVRRAVDTARGLPRKRSSREVTSEPAGVHDITRAR